MSKPENNNQEPPKYWKGLEEYERHESFEKNKHKEFPDDLPVDSYHDFSHKEHKSDLPVEEIFKEESFDLSTDRRSFLKYFGLSVSAATIAACTETPVRKAIPYVNQPEEITPGVPNYYATTLGDASEPYSILVKTREGRPIKIEGNNESPLGGGGTCAIGQASVLNLYDKGRLRGPLKNQDSVTWDELDEDVRNRLANINENGGNIRILSRTITSPSTNKVLENFRETYPQARHITYEPVSSYAIREANRQSFEEAVIPDYRFDRAMMIVSFGADFLGTWLSPVEFTRHYIANRRVRGDQYDMSYHVQFESCLTITGSNADRRVTLKPSLYGKALVALYNKLAQKAGKEQLDEVQFELAGNSIQAVADELWRHRGNSLIVCGTNDVDHQLLVNAINDILGNIGHTVDLTNPSYQKQENDQEVEELIGELENGQVDALIFSGANPVYDHPKGAKIAEHLENVDLTVSTSDRLSETAMKCEYVAPEHHFLEAWNDHNPKKGLYTLSQPTITPIFNTRSTPESLLRWIGNEESYYDFIRAHWQENQFEQQQEEPNFDSFWVSCVHDGFFKTEKDEAEEKEFKASLDETAQKAIDEADHESVEIVLYEKVGMREGKYANNPWLQEMPDPVTKACWDNYACLSPKYAKDHNIKEEDVIKIEAGGYSVELPALLQPGQTYNTIGIAVGFGRQMHENAGKVANGVGANAFPFARLDKGSIRFDRNNVNIEKTGRTYRIAKTQTHHNLEGEGHHGIDGRANDILREATVQELKRGEYEDKYKDYYQRSLYKEWEFNGYHWGMAIDLSACTGCGSCVIACQAENNVPVVGKEEVLRRREMHWIRIDRYYSGDPENPSVVFQPMMCQQCDKAPCENVCPVAAIATSQEGLNMQVYNRCVGTRYCQNNCPFKVRRFNWFNYADNDRFDYNMNNQLGRMALNPDVTVRSRGVMEKCTFCAQKIQEKKLKAKKEGRAVQDGEVKTACQSACPADAIKFGDMNDPESEVRKWMDEQRAYEALEVLDVDSSIRYLPNIKNHKHEEQNEA